MHVWFSVINFPIKNWKIVKNPKILPKFEIINLGIFFILFFVINPFFKVYLRKKLKILCSKNSLFSIYNIHKMQFYLISHFFFGKENLDIKMGLSCHENKCHRISKMSVLPALRTKLLLYVRHETPSITSTRVHSL